MTRPSGDCRQPSTAQVLLAPWLAPFILTRCMFEGVGAFTNCATGGWSRSAGEDRCRFFVEIQAMKERPATVSVDLQPGAESVALRAGAAELDEGGGTLKDVEVKSDGKQVRIEISVPKDAKKGTYRSKVTDRSGFPWGTVSIEVGSAEQGAGG